MAKPADYKLIQRLASPSADEGLTKPRAILLLWFLRNVWGIDDLEAYENVCDGDNDQGIDGMLLEAGDPETENSTLVLFQSEYPTKLKTIGPKKISEFIGRTAPFRTVAGLRDLLQGTLEPELADLIQRFELEQKLQDNSLDVRLVFVSAGSLEDSATKLVRATNRKEGRGFISTWDLDRLAPIALAVTTPTTVKADVTVNVPRGDRFITEAGAGRVAVCAVKASDVVKWPGIDDRSLFDLNVRHELRPNRVRRVLDRAIRKAEDHQNFLAFHNGLTVVCDEIKPTTRGLTIRNLSVVNGTQSAVAFKENESVLSEDLRVIVKFVEVPTESQVAREVAVRSNTQNPVNARNLRALDGIQLRLEREFGERFPKITYETRPDYSHPPSGKVISNDNVAQLLCAIYNQKPWLAVKRLSLFEAENYPTIFTPETSPEQIVLVDLIRERVQRGKNSFPEEYRRSWQLTALIASYLVGQLMRAGHQALLDNPAAALGDRNTLEKLLDELVRHAAGTLTIRSDNKKQHEDFDDFKVDFKRESALKELGTDARAKYLYHKTVSEGE